MFVEMEATQNSIKINNLLNRIALRGAIQIIFPDLLNQINLITYVHDTYFIRSIELDQSCKKQNNSCGYLLNCGIKSF